MDLRGLYQSIGGNAEEGGRPAFDPQHAWIKSKLGLRQFHVRGLM